MHTAVHIECESVDVKYQHCLPNTIIEEYSILNRNIISNSQSSTIFYDFMKFQINIHELIAFNINDHLMLFAISCYKMHFRAVGK